MSECKFEESPTNLVVMRKMLETLKWTDFQGSKQAYMPVDVQGGKGFIAGLLKRPEIAVSDNFESAGANFPGHVHPGWEIFIVYIGTMQLQVEKEVIKLSADERWFHWFDATKNHGAYFPEDCSYIAITVPGDKDWPNGG